MKTERNLHIAAAAVAFAAAMGLHKVAADLLLTIVCVGLAVCVEMRDGTRG